MQKHSAGWWFLVFFHNLVVHPILPLGDVAEAVLGENRLSKGIFWLHDNSAPYEAG
jgi:hypothetical protein